MIIKKKTRKRSSNITTTIFSEDTLALRLYSEGVSLKQKRKVRGKSGKGQVATGPHWHFPCCMRLILKIAYLKLG